MRNQRTQTIVEASLCVALSAALNLVALRLPINIAGGSISLAMLPIAIIALRRGALTGAIAGTTFGLIDLLMEFFILYPAQVVLDYPLPYLLFGMGVGVFSTLYYGKPSVIATPSASASVAQASAAATPSPSTSATSFAPTLLQLTRKSAVATVAFFVGGTGRFISHVLSGVLFFAEYAGGQNVWVYSLVYNISYLLPSLVASAVCAIAIMPVLDRAAPARSRGAA